MNRFKDLVNEEVIKEETNKRGVKLFTATRKVMTCTIRKLQVKFFEKYNMNISIGTIFNLKPFFISFPTEKEKILCMCKLCLNLHIKFDCIMEHTKNENGKVFTFMSNFYMDNCTCNKSELWYWSFDCCNGSCDSCKNINLPGIPSLSNETLVKYFQFEVAESEYKSKKTGELKTTKRTERVQRKASIADLVD